MRFARKHKLRGSAVDGLSCAETLHSGAGSPDVVMELHIEGFETYVRAS
jgi:hypothetical protein